MAKPTALPGLILCAALLAATPIAAQRFGWVLPGQYDETTVKSRPRESLFGKQNSNMLVLVTRGDSVPILAPFRGVVRRIEYKYWYDFQRAATWRIPHVRSAQERDEHLAALARANGLEQHTLAASITIDSAGYSTTISGLQLAWGIRVGSVLRRGDSLGTAGRFLSDIKEPNIGISLKEYGSWSNPLAHFSLASSNPNPRTDGFKKLFTPAEQQEDLAVLYHLIVRANPNAFIYASTRQFDSLYSRMVRASRMVHDYNWLHKQCNLLSKIGRDERTAISSPAAVKAKRPKLHYPALFGVLNDSLVITWAHPSIGRYVGRRIAAVDGIEADSIVRYIKQQVQGPIGAKAPGGYTQGTNNLIAFVSGSLIYNAWLRPFGTPQSVAFELDDGSIMAYPPLAEDAAYERDVPPSFTQHIDAQGKGNATARLLSPTCGYIGLPSLDTARCNIPELQSFIRQLQRNLVESLIIDLRGAQDGQVETAATLFALIAQRPFKPYAYLETKLQNAYQIFQDPRTEPDSLPAPSDYQWHQATQTYRRTHTEPIQHDSIQGYKGRIYVLINETTHGPASLLAAIVRREKRGAFVGRETGSAYYTLATSPDYQITLPNSRIRVRIPLNRVALDTALTPDQPWGRGIMPDYEFPLSIREFNDPQADTLLQYAHMLASQGEYPVDIVTVDPLPYRITLASVALLAIAIALTVHQISQRARTDR